MASINMIPRLLRIKHLSSSETKRRRRNIDSELEIPNDILEEIMWRLPVTSLIRFRLVSKHWRSLIRSKGFGERYMAHQKSGDPKLFFVCDDLVNRSKNNALFTKTMTLKTMTASLERRRSLRSTRFTGFLEISESCDGLVCIYGMTIPVKLLNPASGMSVSLPLARIQQLHIDHPNLSLEILVCPNPLSGYFRSFQRLGFGKDSFTGRYKLVWLYNTYPAASPSSIICEVLDLEDKKWRFLSTSTALDHHHVMNCQRPAFANGSFYWLTGVEGGYVTTQSKLIVFDIHTEMFRVTARPPFVSPDARSDEIGFCNLDGRLCVSELREDCTQEFWWMVKHDTWEKVFSVDLRSTSTWFRGITYQPLTPLAILRDTNKVILSLCYEHNLVAFDLDPDSTGYHLYFSGYYGLVVPYFPSLLLSMRF